MVYNYEVVTKVLKIGFFVIIALNLILSAWYVLHSDIHFSSDIARDFFLLQELDQKKIVLIGPSSSTGLFHGPLWTYLNYPAYLVGNGNPVVVGWYWILLVLLFLISNFYIAKKLFNTTTAYFFVLMTSVYMVFHANGFYNPHGAMLLVPAFFFFFIRYTQTLKIKYLVPHLLIGSAIVQFQMAIGIPFLILSAIFLVIKTMRSGKKRHLLIFLLFPLLFINFIAFDLRHDFLLFHLLLRFLSSAGREHPSLLKLIGERITLMISGTEILRLDPGYRNFVAFLILLLFLFVQIKDNKYKTIYLSFLYFYVGFFVLSLINIGGPLLYFYQFPLFPFVFLIFSSCVTSRYKNVFILIFFIIFVMNLHTAFSDIHDSANIIGKNIYSWKFLYNLSLKVYQEKEKEFGYFVYSPNVVAFEGKYAMRYAQKTSAKNAHYFKKMPITYLVIAPPPINNPYMEDEWWRINQVKISSQPSSVQKFENGYKIEKYLLSENETTIPFDPGIDPGLHFR